jgi:hypothetical protein
MKRTASPDLNRRVLLSTLAALPILSAPIVPISAQAQTATGDPLPSWNDGPAKQAIIAFTKETTDPASSKFVPREERIATFDQDGTLWVEHPMYTQLVYCLDRVPVVVKAKPELAEDEPFKTVMSGNREAMAKFTLEDLEKVVAVTVSGMSVEEFASEAKKWLGSARHSRWDRPYTDLTYLPMQDVLKYLRANGGIAPRSVELCEASAAVNDVKRPSRFEQLRDCLFPFRSEQQARLVRPEVA